MKGYELPAEFRGFISVGEASNGGELAARLFYRKFRDTPPDHGRHFIVYYISEHGALHVASYLHLWVKERMGLIGGGCSDGNVFRMMTPAQASAVNKGGGLLRQTLLYVFNECRDGLDAFFGHCGDARAKEVDLAAGFLETSDQHLLVNWVEPQINDSERQVLFEKAIAIGPF